jgi:CRISPR-associated endonuclease Csn1
MSRGPQTMVTPVGGGQSYVLGIDLGSASLGWAAIGLERDGTASKVLRAGVRIFDPAVTGDVEKGQDVSNAVARRSARLIRRQFRRRAARQKELFRLLQRHALLPEYQGADSDGSQQRHSILNCLDREISAKWSKSPNSSANAASELPLYVLRKAALDGPLQPFELGRVFYHLSQRRGYQSNRKEKAARAEKPASEQKVDDLSQVEMDIKDLTGEIERAGARTLGEYFASLNPHQQKVRRRWTGRKMYEDEFAQVWEKQAGYHPVLLSENLHREIRHLLFYQRPIKEQSHLIGGCELEPGERRAAWATLEAQQFRILQKVNDLELVYPGQVTGIRLTPEQRKKVFDLLEGSPEAKFEKIRKELELPKIVGFNLQRGGEIKLKGNYTNWLMAGVFDDRWPSMSDEEKKQAIEDWRTIEREDSLIRRAVEFWKLDETGAEWLAKHPAPSGYCSLSRKAIRKLMPLMRDGKRFKEAESEIYGSRFSGGRVYDRIPPVRDVLKTLRNPAIERALTELRKVVNALIRELGDNPYEVRIELARDLKKPRKERAQSTARNRAREKERMIAKAKLLSELGPGFEHPSRADVEKALLHEECGGICPYTGRHIDFASLFGENPQFDVEHIIPFSRIPDDSFQNKTLCYHEENRNVKRNQTPFEAYREREQFEAILNRLRNWPKPNRGKITRFELKTTEQLNDSSSRQLNDTRYASKLACDLLGTLYGGRGVDNGLGSRQVVFASSGMVTATLRRGWGLEAILREASKSANGQNKGKIRADHRHHAIDAITIALSRPNLIAALSRSNAQDPYWPRNGRIAPKIQAPWKDFVESIRPQIEQMLVSHRPEHRLTGALHDATNYGRPRMENGKRIVHIRVPVAGKNRGEGLTENDIKNIVDPAVREAVAAKAADCGGDFKNWTPNTNLDDWPQLKTRSGKAIPIKRVRIKKVLAVETIAEATESERHVAANSVHHVAIFVTKDRKGHDKWISEIVTVLQAADRLEEERRRCKEHPDRKPRPFVHGWHSVDINAEFLFFLMKKDTLRITVEGKRRVYLVTSFEADGRISLIPVTASGKRSDQRGSKEQDSAVMIRESLSSLKERCPEKVQVDRLGRAFPARDNVLARP